MFDSNHINVNGFKAWVYPTTRSLIVRGRNPTFTSRSHSVQTARQRRERARSDWINFQFVRATCRQQQRRVTTCGSSIASAVRWLIRENETARHTVTPSNPSNPLRGCLRLRSQWKRWTKKRSGATIALRCANIELQAGASGENERRILSRSRQNGRRGRRDKKKKKMGTHSLFLSHRAHGERRTKHSTLPYINTRTRNARRRRRRSRRRDAGRGSKFRRAGDACVTHADRKPRPATVFV